MDFTPTYPIETERLRLRPFTRGDVDAVFAYRQRPDVARYLMDEPMTRETCTEAVQFRVSQFAFSAESDKIFLAVDRRDDNLLLGEVSLVLRDRPARQAELGYIFNPDYHGAGYATEAAGRLLELGFAGAGLHRIYARCAADNVKSWRLMERLGMRREAEFREHALVKGGWDHELIYALLEGEWRDRSLA